MSATSWQRHRHPRAGHARVDEDRDVELHALGVERVHLLVVDRHLGEEPGGEDLRRADAEFLDAGLELADASIPRLGSTLHARDEAVGVLHGRGLARPGWSPR